MRSITRSHSWLIELQTAMSASASTFASDMRHLDVIKSPRQPARQYPARADLCEEPAAQLAGKLLLGNLQTICGSG
jgi:hypothetical protein